MGSRKAPAPSSGWIFLAGTLTGVAFCLLWAAAAAIVWTSPERAPAAGVVIAVIMMTLTVLAIILRQLGEDDDKG